MSEQEWQQAQDDINKGKTATEACDGFEEFVVFKSKFSGNPACLQQIQAAQRTPATFWLLPIAVIGFYTLNRLLLILVQNVWARNTHEALLGILLWILMSVVFFILAGVILPIIDNARTRLRIPLSIAACLILANYFASVTAAMGSTDSLSFLAFEAKFVLLPTFVVSSIICGVRAGRRKK